MKATRYTLWLAACALLPAATFAQDRPRPATPAAEPPAVTVGPPIQRIESAAALSTERIGVITGVRELPDGRVLVNDGTRRRLLLLDTTLTSVEVVLDSLTEVSNTYGVRAGALLPYRGDSIMFVDPASLAAIILDPAGKIARIRSVWRAQDVFYFTSFQGYGMPGIDAKGRIIYRINAVAGPPKVAPPPGVPWYPVEPDSAFLIGVDFDTRRVDTVGVVRTPKYDYRMRMTVEGYWTTDQVINPIPVSDDWAVLSDGTIALIRAVDYRVEYLNPDGTRSSSAKLPFEWQRLTDDDKKHVVDSVANLQRRFAMNNYATSMVRWVNMYNGKYPPGFTVPAGFVLGPGFAKDAKLPPGVTFPENYVYACAPGVEPVMPPMPSPGQPQGMPSCFPAPITMGGGQTPLAPTMRPVLVIAPEELPDYKPPIAQSTARADFDGNIWIRTMPPKPIPGGLVYDIINRKGELTTRYQLPPGYTLVGFGRDKVVYLSMRDATGIHLARVRLR